MRPVGVWTGTSPRRASKARYARRSPLDTWLGSRRPKGIHLTLLQKLPAGRSTWPVGDVGGAADDDGDDGDAGDDNDGDDGDDDLPAADPRVAAAMVDLRKKMSGCGTTALQRRSSPKARNRASCMPSTDSSRLIQGASTRRAFVDMCLR